KVTPITRPEWTSADALTVRHPTAMWILQDKSTIPSAQTPSTVTLISSDAEANTYSYGYFYTFENEVGESAASRITTIKAARGWSQWRFKQPTSGGGESLPTTNPSN